MDQEIEIDPSNAGAEYVLGELARQAAQWPEAVGHFSRASKLDAGFGDAFLGLGQLAPVGKEISRSDHRRSKLRSSWNRRIRPHTTVWRSPTLAPAAKQEGDKEFAIHRQMMQSSQPRGEPPDQEPQSKVSAALDSPRWESPHSEHGDAALLAGIFCGFWRAICCLASISRMADASPQAAVLCFISLSFC